MNIIYKYKRLMVSLLLTAAVICSFAVPAKRQTGTFLLSDGSKIELTIAGDEHSHWFVDANGARYTVNEGIATLMTPEQIEKQKTVRTHRIKQANARRLSRLTAVKKSESVNDYRMSYVGKKKGIVLLVNFEDKKLSKDNTKDKFVEMFNEPGYSENGHIGSVHDYFYDQSYGVFDLSFDIVGPLQLSNTMGYYGENDANGNDKRPCEMVAEAVRLADEEGVNFADYDWDGDGYVDQVFIIYAGYGENTMGVTSAAIWPHEYDLNSGADYNDGEGEVLVDGVMVNTYAVSCELSGRSGANLNPIGTACHEFSHCLGFPDLYDTEYSGGVGMMAWDVLCSGNYNGPYGMGEVPAGFSAFERWMAGWMEPVTLDSPCDIDSLTALTSSPNAYIMYNDGNKNEFYMLENRQNSSWDEYIGGPSVHGMLITHIDFDAEAWIENTINNESNHQRVTYFPADNSYGTMTSSGNYTASERQYAGDPFPGILSKTAFTNITLPAAKLYNNNVDGTKFMSKPITDIKETDGVISFKFMGGAPLPATPEVAEPSDITDSGFTMNWIATDDAETYTLNLMEVDENGDGNEYALFEDCSHFTGNASGADSSTDISKQLDQYTCTPGWYGYKVYSGNTRIKIGSSSAAGYIATPVISKPANGTVTITLDQMAYGSDSKNMLICVINGDTPNENVANAVQIGMRSIEMASTKEEGQNTIVKFEGIETDFRLRIAPSKRGYIYGLKVETNEGKGSTIITGISENSYTFTDLSSGKYKCRVRGVAGNRESEWSEPVEVTISTTGIDSAINEPDASGNAIYNLNGQRVSTTVGNGINRPLERGIYLTKNKKVLKK